MTELNLSLKTMPQVVLDAAARFGTNLALVDGDAEFTFVKLDQVRIQVAKHSPPAVLSKATA